MKKFFKTALLCGLIVCLFVSALVTEAAGITFTVKSDKTAVKQGDCVTVTAENSAISGIIALSATLNYDSSKFTVVSQTCENNSFNGAYVSSGTSGSVKFVWDADSNTNIGAGKMISVILMANDSAAVGNSDVSLTINSIFSKSGSSYIAKLYEVSNPVGIEIKQSEISSKVSETIALINAIGTVDTSDDCLNRITAAMDAFSALGSSEQSQVTNYQVLQDSYNMYYYLKNKELDEANKVELENTIAAFRENHKDLLNLSENDVTISHKVAVLAALNKYEMSTAYVRSKLTEEATHLKKLKSKIDELEDDLTKQEESISEVEGFRESFKALINTPLSYVFLSDDFKTQINIAKSTYSMLNEYSQEALRDDYSKILEIEARYEELELLNEPDSEYVIKSANEYTDKYLTLLAKSPDDLTADDAALVSAALEDFKNLPNGARGRLLTQFEKLMSMQSYLNTDPSEEGQVEYIVVEDGGTNTVEYVYVNGEETSDENAAEQTEKALNYTIDGAGMKNSIIYLVILLATSMFTAAGSASLYMWLRRKENLNDA